MDLKRKLKTQDKQNKYQDCVLPVFDEPFRGLLHAPDLVGALLGVARLVGQPLRVRLDPVQLLPRHDDGPDDPALALGMGLPSLPLLGPGPARHGQRDMLDPRDDAHDGEGRVLACWSTQRPQ